MDVLGPVDGQGARLDLGPKTDPVQVRALEEASVRLVDQSGQ